MFSLVRIQVPLPFNNRRYKLIYDCDICGKYCTKVFESGKQKVCASCKDKLADHICNKCLNCGTYGFIPITKENVNKVLAFLPLSQTEITTGNLVVLWPDCPACGGKEKRQELIRNACHC